jgi:hypothetical protein
LASRDVQEVMDYAQKWHDEQKQIIYKKLLKELDNIISNWADSKQIK